MNDIDERIRTALRPYRASEDLYLEPQQPSPVRTHRRGLRVLAMAAAVVVITLVAAVLPRWIPAGPDPAAAGLLQRLAIVAQHAPAEPAPSPGQYVYSKTRSIASRLFVSADGTYRIVYTVPETEQRWLGLDGSGRVLTTTGTHPTFATQADADAYRAYLASGGAPIEDWRTTATDTYKSGGLTSRDTSSLPTDPTQLGQLIEDRSGGFDGPSGDWESFALATDLIRDSYARPELRAAAYTYMSGLSGVEMIGPTTDAAGRHGVALASSHDGVRYEVVFDKATGDILEERDVALETNEGVYNNPGPGTYAFAYAGQPIYIGTYVSKSQVVDSTTQTS